MFKASVRIFLAEAFFFIIIIMEDKEFINVINEYYPFERYIVKSPKSLEPTFDDLILTELFVPNTEIKPILHNGHLVYFTNVNPDEIYVKVRGKAGEMRIGYYDFAKHIRNEIIEIILGDIGGVNWQSLYAQDTDEDLPDLEKMLNEQKSLIEIKYGDCLVKKDSLNARFVHV